MIAHINRVMRNFMRRVLFSLKCRWKNMLNPELYFQNYIVFTVGALLRILHIPPFYQRYKQIKNIKNIHKGKRIFVVATGPSLCVEDVEKLKNEITIGLNTIFDIYPMTEWRPTYYFLGDFKGIDIFNSRKVDIFAKKYVILSHKFRGKVNVEQAIYVPMSWLDHWYNYENTTDLRYSDNLLWGMYCLLNSTALAINLATYMGASEVVLIGCDNDYRGKFHFADDETSDMIDDKADHAERTYIGSVKAFEFVKKETEKRNCKVINATRGGRLEVFERQTLEDVLSISKRK